VSTLGEHAPIRKLGYPSFTRTMDTYSHLLDGIGDDAVEALDESFG